MAALCILLLVACLTDYLWAKIPNWLILLIVLAGLVSRCVVLGGYGLWLYTKGCILIVLSMYPLFKVGTVGAGDVKLFAAVAGYLSGKVIFYFLFFSLLIAAFFSVIKIMKEHSGIQRLCYFCTYLMQVIRDGEWQLYFTDRTEQKNAGICLSGPILLSVLLHIGGVY